MDASPVGALELEGEESRSELPPSIEGSRARIHGHGKRAGIEAKKRPSDGWTDGCC